MCQTLNSNKPKLWLAFHLQLAHDCNTCTTKHLYVYFNSFFV